MWEQREWRRDEGSGTERVTRDWVEEWGWCDGRTRKAMEEGWIGAVWDSEKVECEKWCIFNGLEGGNG